MFSDAIEDLSRQVIALAARRGRTIATVESCTGGLVAGALTGVPGSSAVVDRGFVTYSNAAKTQLVRVPARLITTHGAVSEQTARAMAEGGRVAAGVDLAVSITGIAGPDGGSEDKPVGLVHFATATADLTRHQECRFGDRGRQAIRLAAVETALRMLLAALEPS